MKYKFKEKCLKFLLTDFITVLEIKSKGLFMNFDLNSCFRQRVLGGEFITSYFSYFVSFWGRGTHF